MTHIWTSCFQMLLPFTVWTEPEGRAYPQKAQKISALSPALQGRCFCHFVRHGRLSGRIPSITPQKSVINGFDILQCLLYNH